MCLAGNVWTRAVKTGTYWLWNIFEASGEDDVPMIYESWGPAAGSGAANAIGLVLDSSSEFNWTTSLQTEALSFICEIGNLDLMFVFEW